MNIGYRQSINAAIFIVFIIFNVIWHHLEAGEDLASSYMGCLILDSGLSDHVYDYDASDYSRISGSVWLREEQTIAFRGHLHPYVQTPLWAWAISPLCTHMSFDTFKLLFLTLSFAALAGIVWLTAATSAKLFLNRSVGLIALLSVFSFTLPVEYMAFLGQTHALFLFLTITAIYFADKNKSVLAGLLLAVATIVKITPGLLAVYWVINRQYRSAVSFAIAYLMLFLLSIAVLGVGINIRYFANLHRISDVLLVAFNNQSFAAWAGDFLYGGYEMNKWHIHAMPSYIVIINYLFLAGFVAVLALFAHKDRKRFALCHYYHISLVLVVSMMFANIAWSHYYIVLVVPLMVMISDNIKGEHWIVFIFLSAIITLNITPVCMGIHYVPDHATLIRAHFWSGVICIGLLMHHILLRMSNAYAKAIKRSG